MKFHEAANLFPLMSCEELSELAIDIRENGLIEPIVTLEEEILDGRNRWLACEEVGVEPELVEWDGECGDPVRYVISENLKRRHLTPTCRSVVSVEALPLLQAEARKRMSAGGGDKRSPAAKTGSDKNTLPDSDGRQARDDAAKATGVSPSYVQDAKRIKVEAPDLFEDMRQGEKTIQQAKRELKRREVHAKLESIESKESRAASGTYDVVVIDPPWQMEKIERDVTPNQVAFEYPTMSEGELAALDIPCADDAHVWLWTTHKHLPMAFRLLQAWRLKYVCTFVWHKPGGFQPFGLPQYNCEFSLYARRGSPEFVTTKAFSVCSQADRGAHSEKPEKFYEVIRRVTAGRRLDMFNRRPIDGFEGWGKEAHGVSR